MANGKAIRPYILHKRQKKIIECVLVEEWSGPFDSHLPRVVHWKVKFSLFYQKMIFFRSKKSCHSLQAKHKLKEIKWLRGQLWQFLLGRSFESLTIFLAHFLAFFPKKETPLRLLFKGSNLDNGRVLDEMSRMTNRLTTTRNFKSRITLRDVRHPTQFFIIKDKF